MKRYQLFIISLFLFNFSIKSQIGVGEWRDHFCYKAVTEVVGSNNKIYAATNLGLFSVDESDYSIEKMNYTNGLSDFGITALFNTSDNKVVVGYNNGNVDIITDNGTKIINIPDFKLKNIQGNKQINNIYEFNNKLYLSNNIGILVVDFQKYEISDFYYLGPNNSSIKVYQCTNDNSYFYAATEKGVFRSPVNGTSLVFDKNSIAPIAYYRDIVNFNGKIIWAKSSSGDNYTTAEIQYFDGNTTTLINTPVNFNKIKVFNNLLYLVEGYKITTFNLAFNFEFNITQLQFENNATASPSFSSITVYNNKSWIGDLNFGLIKFNSNSLSYSYIPNGPNSNYAFRINSSNTATYVSPGGYGDSFVARGYLYEYYYFKNEIWSTINKKDIIPESNMYDFLTITVNPKNQENIFISSFGYGLFEFNNNTFSERYTKNNSTIQNIDWVEPGKDYYQRVDGLDYDKDGNLYMTNQEVPNGIVVYTNDKKWYSYNYYKTSNVKVTAITAASDGKKWVLGRQNLFVFDDNKTFNSDSDDSYRCADPNTSDSRCKGDLKVWDENGDIITSQVNCVEEDKDGYIWLGTDKGVMVYYNTKDFFTTAKPYATRIKVPRNDGSGLADYLLENDNVTCIAIDGANRKWIGTSNSGIFLQSEDGTKNIQTFNKENSPLISNSIVGISIQPTSGEVFISTDLGLVSYRGNATSGVENIETIKTFPNPVRNDYNGDIIINGLTANSTVKIVDISGQLVYETTSLGGQAVWNGRNFQGNRASTGVYIVFVTNEDGTEKGSTKILFVN